MNWFQISSFTNVFSPKCNLKSVNVLTTGKKNFPSWLFQFDKMKNSKTFSFTFPMIFTKIFELCRLLMRDIYLFLVHLFKLADETLDSFLILIRRLFFYTLPRRKIVYSRFVSFFYNRANTDKHIFSLNNRSADTDSHKISQLHKYMHI